ncbi:MAG: hypothetical protein H6R17_2590 [Proteobacteria bacterium]|nr:hypothetical protein [Pseudomonadota bacterium]
MNRIVQSLVLSFALTLLAGCGGGSGSGSNTPAPLSADNLNLIFVVSPDLAYHAEGDLYKDTANLTNQGVQRSLMLASYLQQQVLGTNKVSRIYALQPMSHLQTTNATPDMSALLYIEQFAMLNQITLSSGQNSASNYGYPINVSYKLGSLPDGVATPDPKTPCSTCQGLVFNDSKGDNAALVDAIVKTKAPGFHVFSAPWETISALLSSINTRQGYQLALPARYTGPNAVHAISITPSGAASLITYDSALSPPASYPALPPPPLGNTACTVLTPSPFAITATGAPAGTNTNQTLYLVRHAEAHPTNWWESGNYVAAGQWRALALGSTLGDTLRGKIAPSQVWSIDPAQVIPGASSSWGNSSWSYVRPSLTVAPYAMANNLPYNLVADFELFAVDSPSKTRDFFFKTAKFSGTTMLLAWEHDHIPWIVDALLAGYASKSQSLAPAWPGADYDSIWTVTLDAVGNATVTNAKCEGIDLGSPLPSTAPVF